MSQVQPWATCLLTGMLIDYLERRYPDTAGRVDYRSILNAAEFIQDIRDPRAFLMDPSNWVPHSVFRDLIKRCEQVSGEKQFTYQAALAYYDTAQVQFPTLIETIAILLNDIESVFRSVGNWASAYTNYLQLQSFVRADEPHTLHILSRYLPPVEPRFGNIRLVQGNVEGIAKLDPTVDHISCDEEYSQIRLSTLVAEFGDAYSIRSKPNRVTVVRGSTGETVLTATPMWLASEQVPVNSGAGDLQTPDDQWIVQPDAAGRLAVCAADETPHASESWGAGTPPPPAIRIEQGGTLSVGPLSVALKSGTILDAPYTRYRLRWTKRPSGTGPSQTDNRAQIMTDRRALALLLFAHLKNLQATHRRALHMFLHNVELAQENIELKHELAAGQETGGIIGRSQAIQDLLSLIQTVAASDATVLITGETGTGKELAARLTHRLSRRQGHRFVAINCGAVPETLLESELFGHERGAFTGAVAQKKGKFELAGGGTLFLDEIGDISPTVQVKLLRVLQEKAFQRVGGTADLTSDVRIITATNRDLEALIEQKQFRRDLYYRLNVIQVSLPPLRERTEDILELSKHFIQQFTERAGKAIKGLTPETLNLCLAYAWPGNIRELENVMERAVTLAPDTSHWVTPDLLPPHLRNNPDTAILRMDVMEFVKRIEWPALRLALRKCGSLSALLGQIEWAITSRAVAESGGNKSRAARALGRTYRWLRKLEAQMSRDRPPT